MHRTGPALELLTRRLLDTPPDFLDEPRIGKTGQVVVPAVVNDLLQRHGARAPLQALRRFESSDARQDRNRLAVTLVMAWLLAQDWFVAQHIAQDALLALLDDTAAELAQATPAHRFALDPERREELARVVLARLSARPEGESEAQATDRLSALSGVERRRLIEASRAAEQRAREIRAALAQKAAEESADKWTRE